MNYYKTNWHQGLLLKAQHLLNDQQYFIATCHQEIDAISKFTYGMGSLEIDYSLLAQGIFKLNAIELILKNGEYVKTCNFDELPPAIRITLNSSKKNIYLKLSSPQAYRQKYLEVGLIDDKVEMEQIEINYPAFELTLDNDNESNLDTFAIAKIKSIDSQGIILDDKFIACSYSTNLPVYSNYIAELQAILENICNLNSKDNSLFYSDKQKAIAQIIAPTMLELSHIKLWRNISPEKLYLFILKFYAKLSLITSSKIIFIAYNHLYPSDTFAVLFSKIRELTTKITQVDIHSIGLICNDYGIFIADKFDFNLLNKYLLVVKIFNKTEQKLDSSLFLKNIKISFKSKIKELISLQLPGLNLIEIKSKDSSYEITNLVFAVEIDSQSINYLSNNEQLALYYPAYKSDINFKLLLMRKNESK